MDLHDENPTPQITKVTLFVYEGDLQYDADGKITNKLRETLTFEKELTHGNRDQRQESDS
jgi:hypothetical protein